MIEAGQPGALVLSPRPPFRLDLTVWALRRGALNEVDRWDGRTYRRAFVLDHRRSDIAITQRGGCDEPLLDVYLGQDTDDVGGSDRVRATLNWMLALDRDVDPFYAGPAGDPQIAALVHRFRGLRPPRFPTVFECLVNAVALQQFSLSAGLTLLNRLARTFGASSSLGESVWTFPEPAELLAATPGSIRALGFSRRKADSLIAIADAAHRGHLQNEALTALDDEQVVEALTEIDGIGRWSAEYALLRGLGRLHVFPGDDVGARNGLARLLGRDPFRDYASVRDAVALWQPYAGMIYFHLLLDRLATQGLLE
jgi:DNA-3-methyladenine glycosylase II